jgi:hypothetical protein
MHARFHQRPHNLAALQTVDQTDWKIAPWKPRPVQPLWKWPEVSPLCCLLQGGGSRRTAWSQAARHPNHNRHCAPEVTLRLTTRNPLAAQSDAWHRKVACSSKHCAVKLAACAMRAIAVQSPPADNMQLVDRVCAMAGSMLTPALVEQCYQRNAADETEGLATLYRCCRC